MNNAFCRTIGMQPYRLRYGDRYLHRYNQFVDLHLDDENLIQGDSSGLIESINDSLKLCYEIAQLTQNKEIYKLLCKNPFPDDTLKVGHYYVVANQPDDIFHLINLHRVFVVHIRLFVLKIVLFPLSMCLR